MIDVAGGNAVYYYHFDGVGSVIALSDVNSVIVERYSYDVFGAPNTTSGIGNPYLFTGRRYDIETALYYYRARYYDYYIGRFLQVDPIGYQESVNFYTYVGNNPVRWVDSFGLCKDDKEEDFRSKRIEQLRSYIESAEKAMITNIEALNVIHREIKGVHDYYYTVLVLDTASTVATVAVASYKLLYKSYFYANAAKMATKAPFPNAVDASVKLSNLAKGTRKAAMRAFKREVATKGGVGAVSIFAIDKARRRAIAKKGYIPMANSVMANIENLSAGVAQARQELRRLSYE